MTFFATPAGYKPADSMTIGLTTAAGVVVIYNAKVGPVADLHASQSGDPGNNATIRKAGVESLLLVTAMTLLSRDLNVAILGYAAVLLEHTMHLHAEMANPANGQIQAGAAAYQPPGGQLAAVAG